MQKKIKPHRLVTLEAFFGNVHTPTQENTFRRQRHNMLQSLTEQEILGLTITFLALYNSRTKPDDSGILMNSLIRYKKNIQPINDDKIIWKDWQDCLEAFSNNKIENEFVESDAFEIFEDFLEKYFHRNKLR